MDDSLSRQAIIALGVKFFCCLDVAVELREEIERLSKRQSENNKAYDDLVTAFRVFGIDIQDDNEYQRFSAEYFDEIYREKTGKNQALVVPPPAPTALPPRSKENLSELIVRRLQELGETGAKSSQLKEWLKTAHSIEVHDKTPGMTLYRLSKEMPPKAHRRGGHTWFFGPQVAETKNPGVDAPGQIEADV